MSSESDTPTRRTALRALDGGASRRSWLKAIGTAAGTLPFLGGTAAGGEPLEITVFITEKLYDKQGSHPQDVAAAYMEQAIGQSSSTLSYDVFTPDVRFDMAEAQSTEGGDNLPNWFKDFYCCGRYAVGGDPRDHMAKDLNLLVKYDQNPGGSNSFDHRSWTWVEDFLENEDPSSPDDHKWAGGTSIGDDNLTTPYRIYTVVHEGGHGLPDTGGTVHNMGDQHLVWNSFANEYDLHATPFAVNESYDDDDGDGTPDNHCNDELATCSDCQKYYHYVYSDCFGNHITTVTYSDACSRCTDTRSCDSSEIRPCQKA